MEVLQLEFRLGFGSPSFQGRSPSCSLRIFAGRFPTRACLPTCHDRNRRIPGAAATNARAGSRWQAGSAGRANEAETSPALQAELRARPVFVLAPRTLHHEVPGPPRLTLSRVGVKRGSPLPAPPATFHLPRSCLAVRTVGASVRTLDVRSGPGHVAAGIAQAPLKSHGPVPRLRTPRGPNRSCRTRRCSIGILRS